MQTRFRSISDIAVLGSLSTSPSTDVLQGSAYSYTICTIIIALRGVSQWFKGGIIKNGNHKVPFWRGKYAIINQKWRGKYAIKLTLHIIYENMEIVLGMKFAGDHL